MRLYIAGPMTGHVDFNYPAFFRAADALRSAGYDPINPARAEGREGCASWLDFMRASLRDLADCDGVATLEGWGMSRGARLEVEIADTLDLPARAVEAWLEDADRSALSPTKEAS